MPREEDVILYDAKGKPLRWWIHLSGYSRRTVGFVSPELREKWDEYMAGVPDERPSVAVDNSDAEVIWMEVEEEEEEEDE